MDTPDPPDNPLSQRNLDVRLDRRSSLTQVLAWMLVLVLTAFVVVSLWFAARMMSAHEEVESAESRAATVTSEFEAALAKASDDARKEAEDKLEPVTTFRDVFHYKLRLEEAQFALDAGDRRLARTVLEACDPALCGWEHAWLLQQVAPALLTGPNERRLLALAFDSAGKALDAVATDGTVRRWDVRRGRPLPAVPLAGVQDTPVLATVHAATHKVAVGTDRAVQVFNGETGAHLRTCRVPGAAGPLALAFSPDGASLAFSVPGKVCVWEVGTGKTTLVLNRENAAVRALAFSPTGKELAVGEDRKVTLWGPTTGEEHSVPRKWFPDDAPSGTIGRLVYDPTGTELAALTGERALLRHLRREIDPSQDTLRLLRRVPARLHDVVFSPDGKRIVAACGDGRVRLWDEKTSLEVAAIPATSGPLTLLAFSPDGRRLAVAGADGSVRLLDPGEEAP
jgi:WD40 repeat protein